MSRASSRLRAKKLEVGSKDTAPTQSTSRGNAKAQPKRKKAELLATTEPTQQSAGPALARETPRSDSSRATATQKRWKAEPLATTEPPQQSPVSAAQAKAPAIWAKVRGRRGHLKMVVEMPFDILLEIFQYVDVTDLLTLVRSSRALRRWLLDRSLALPVWKSVSLSWSRCSNVQVRNLNKIIPGVRSGTAIAATLSRGHLATMLRQFLVRA